MSTFCATCNGSGEVKHFGQLDCMAAGCTAATERAALDTHLLALGRLHERDLVWEAYKLGQAKAQGDKQAGMVVKATFGAHKILVATINLDSVEIGTKVYFAAPANNNTEKADE